MKITLFLFAFVALSVGLLSARDIPNANNPSLEYEIINPSKPQPIKPSVIEENLQSGQSNNKTFAYDPASQKWSVVKQSDGEPKEGTLLWNQNNDKWLTQSFRP